jgi:hypothetical protein
MALTCTVRFVAHAHIADIISPSRNQSQPLCRCWGTVPDEKTYNLTAYDADTGKQVLYWFQVAPNHQFVAGDVIDHDGDQWMVIGVRADGTAEERRVDVRLVTQPED